VMPCVFTPYSTHNIYEVFRNGGNLNTILASPLLRNLREWQDAYGYARPPEETGNWLCPCPIRDHFDECLEIVRGCGGRPIDPGAEAALCDSQYQHGMVECGRSFDRLSRPVWQREYLSQAAARPRREKVAV